MLKKLGLQVVVVLAGALFFSANAQTTTVGTISGTVRAAPFEIKREPLFPGPKFLFRMREVE